ncbi:MAG: alpha-N-arabinofuranosidase [Bacteroidales bacterium]|nr:alpha-N-arabinofuranosidase [Bacteroidales bacterium]
MTLIPGLLLQAQVKVSVHETAADQPRIPAEIYGQFSEHLGRCIYEGIWVGPDSDIPNIDGYRTDVLNALRDLSVPVLRWPGGCFADEYHWMDGIGPRENRPQMVNNNWGGTVEDNSFGTHEFLNLCEMLGTQPYISGNVGSGTVEELAKWVEYMTAEEGTMADLRAANGRKEPWKVKYLGVGNESWGCGGDMDAEYYADVYKRYALYARNYDGNKLFKIACGASEDDYKWTKTVMKKAGGRLNGLSLHYYTVPGWDCDKGSATDFTADEYYNTLTRTAGVEEILRNHIAIMDSYDPDRKVALILDEWGTWYEVEPGFIEGHLYQQNTMRDAMVAAINLNIFHKYTNRLKMCNIAQVVNVLHSMILTDGPRMLLTPTYYIFKMFKVHQDATYVPVSYSPGSITSTSGASMENFSISASRDKNDVLHVSMANPYLDREQKVTLSFDELKPKGVSAQILKADGINAYNDFGKAPSVSPAAFYGAKVSGKTLTLTLPPASVVVLEVK